MARNQDPLADLYDEEPYNPALAEAEALMDEARERQGGRDMRDIPSYRHATSRDNEPDFR